MKPVFLIKRIEDGKYLNQKENWSKSIVSYRLKEFNTEEEATAAIPKDVECTIIKINKNTPNIDGKHYLQNLKNNLFLNINNEFKCSFVNRSEIMFFDNEDAALDKAEALGLDLNFVRVMFLSNQFFNKDLSK